MSNGFQGSQQSGGAGGAQQFFGQMMMMPFSTFVYGMQFLVQMLQGMQQMTGPAGGAAGGFAGGTGSQAAGGANAFGVATSGQTTREEDRAMSNQNWGGAGGQGGGGGQGFGGGGGGQGWGGQQGSGGQQGWGGGTRQGCGPGDQGWSVKDECRDSEPCDQLRLIRFKILFLKRDLEVAFPEQEELVAEDMPKDGFISWKIAEFIQAMGRGEVSQPGKWAEKKYPQHDGGTVKDGKVTALPDKDKRFLRVYCQVLECYDRERMNYERDQVNVLKEIRDVLKSK